MTPGAPAVTITVLENRGDVRGNSFSVPLSWSHFLPSARDIHVTTLQPGHARGHHFHSSRREVIVVVHGSAWTLRWDTGDGTRVNERVFDGEGAVLLTVDPGAAHAVLNTGRSDVVTIGLTGVPYDPGDPDTHPRPLVSPPDSY